jgi:hypothetical protein
MRSFRSLRFESLESRQVLSSIHQPVTANEPANIAAVVTAPSATATTTTDDAYENNDTFSSASNLGTLTATKTINGLAMNDTVDWYKFKMDSGGTSSDFVKLTFTHLQGDLDLELYSSSGRLLGRSQSVTNSERLSLQNLPAGTYYLRAYGYRGVHNPSYSLTIDPGAPIVAAVTPAPAPAAGAFDIQLKFQGLTSSEQAIFNQAAARWEQIIVGDLPNATYNGVAVDDLLINASAVSIDGVGGTLGQAGPDRFRVGTLFPYHGSMQFDTADLASMERDGSLLSVIEHEIGHILGIGTLWDDRGLLSGAGTSNPRFTGAHATAEYNRIFGRNESGVPVENSGGAGTRDAHWRESVLSSELMTGWAGPGTSLPLSRITVASLADIGYQVDITKADPYTKPGSTLPASTSSSSSSLSGVLAFDSILQRERRSVDDVMTLWGTDGI